MYGRAVGKGHTHTVDLSNTAAGISTAQGASHTPGGFGVSPLTPFTNQSGYPGNNLVKLIFDTLAIVQGDDVTPLLAQQIQTTDNKTFTLPIRQGVTWHDGKPFTADDVIFSVEFYRKNMEGDSAIDVRQIDKLSASGQTITMVLNAPDPEFPRRILADMAKHLWESVAKVSEAGKDKAVGTGPFKLTAYDRRRRPRTQQLVRASAQVGRVAQWRHPLAVLARDTLATLMPAGIYLRSSAETLNWRPPTAAS